MLNVLRWFVVALFGLSLVTMLVGALGTLLGFPWHGIWAGSACIIFLLLLVAMIAGAFIPIEQPQSHRERTVGPLIVEHGMLVIGDYLWCEVSQVLPDIPNGRYRVVVKEDLYSHRTEISQLHLSKGEVTDPKNRDSVELSSDSGELFILALPPETLQQPPPWLKAADDDARRETYQRDKAVGEILDEAGNCVGLLVNSREIGLWAPATWGAHGTFEFVIDFCPDKE